MKANKKTGLTREAIKEFNESRKGLEVDLMDEVLEVPAYRLDGCHRFSGGNCFCTLFSWLRGA